MVNFRGWSVTAVAALLYVAGGTGPCSAQGAHKAGQAKSASPKAEPSKTGTKKPTVSPVDGSQTYKGLTPTQQEAVQASLKALRKLKAATEVGVTLPDYRNRLIDAKAEVDEDSRTIPVGPISEALQNAVQSYQDALTFWTESSQLQSRAKILAGASGTILTKYGLTLDAHGPLPPTPPDLPADPTQEDLDEQKQKIADSITGLAMSFNINEPDRNRIISAIWAAARRSILKAESPASASVGMGITKSEIVAGSVATAGTNPTRVVETAGGFSYVPPTGWKATTVALLKYQVCQGGRTNNFTPTLGAVDVTTPDSLDEFVPQQIGSVPSSMHLLNQAPFITASGLKGMKLTFDIIDSKQRQRFYIFSGRGDQKLIMVATWLASDDDKYGDITDASMKTFALNNAVAAP